MQLRQPTATVGTTYDLTNHILSFGPSCMTFLDVPPLEEEIRTQLFTPIYSIVYAIQVRMSSDVHAFSVRMYCMHACMHE